MINESTSPEAPFVVDGGQVVAAQHRNDFAAFYRAHRDHLGRALALTFNDETLGFEAADEAMARACRQWQTVRMATNPPGWVYRVGLNWGRSWLRRRATAIRTSPELRRIQRLRQAAARSVEELAVDKDLARAISRLDENSRAVVVLRFYADWPVGDIAAALDIPAGTVKSRLSRAMGKLRADLETGQQTKPGGET